MDIRINKESSVPIRQQIAAQIEYQIGIGKILPGDALPSVRALARKLGIHHNTVSQAYQDVTAVQLLSRKHGSRLVVRVPDERAPALHPDLDDLINQAIRAARRHGHTIDQLSQRVRERLADEPPDHILVLSMDPGMRRLLQAEVGEAVKFPVRYCSPDELEVNPDLLLGALVVAAPGVLPSVTPFLSKDRQPVVIHYTSAERHLETVRQLTHPSVIAVVSVSAAFLMISCGLLGGIIGDRHTLLQCLLTDDKSDRIPAADIVFCDAISYPRVLTNKSARNVHVYRMVSAECLSQISATLPNQ